jgi:hypothetical protein
LFNVGNNDITLDNLDEIVDFLDPNNTNYSTNIKYNFSKQIFDNCFMDELDEFPVDNIRNNATKLYTLERPFLSQPSYTLTNDDLNMSDRVFSKDFLSNLLFEALDGFYFILNLNGIIENISDAVSFYTKFTPVSVNLHNIR